MTVAEMVLGGRWATRDSAVRAEVPLVSAAEAADHTAIDNFEPDAGRETIAVSVPVNRHTFALRVEGDSMVGRISDSFPDGSIVVVEPEMSAKPGDYVVVRVGEGEITLKQLIKDGGDFYLKPLNERYPIRPLGTSRVIGVVREFTQRFR